MWYYCWSPKNNPERSHGLYAVSKDGIHWDKPNLGLMPWKVNGTLENYCVGAMGDIIHSPHEPEPLRGYKCIGGGDRLAQPGGRRGLFRSPGHAAARCNATMTHCTAEAIDAEPPKTSGCTQLAQRRSWFRGI